VVVKILGLGLNSKMLSRLARNLYWMQRYRERAENIARLIEVNHILDIDLPDSHTQWKPILEVNSLMDLFKKKYPEINATSVMWFMTFDESNPNSIFNCISLARENARSMREIISSEMWHELNTLYLFLLKDKPNKDLSQDPYFFYNRIKRQSQLFLGLEDSALLRNQAWYFSRIGTFLERADMCSRIIDMKYFILLPSIHYVGTPYDDIQWSALLRSASAFEMYRKQEHRIDPNIVVEFLILGKEFPRSIYFCLKESLELIKKIDSKKSNPKSQDPIDLLSKVILDLESLKGSSILDSGLHEFLDNIQQKIIDVHSCFSEAYFD
jgi:uncharacterized alpha-E superfamily protein